MKQIRWGILGTANIAKHCTIPGIKKATDCILYAIAGRNIDKATAFKEEYGFEKAYGSYDELLDDPDVDAVYIPLPNHIHKEWVIKALDKKKHVLCEKPISLDTKDAEEMFAAAKKNGVYLMEAFAYLHSPFVKALKDEISSGLIGDVDYIDTAFLTQGYKEDFRLYKEYGGGAFYDLGCYCTSMVLSLVDSDVDYAKAVAEFTDRDVDFFAGCLVKFKNDVRVSFNVGMNLGTNSNSRYDRLFIHGTRGNIRADYEYNQEGEISYTVTNADGVTERKVTALSNYTLEIENLSDAIRGTADPLVTPEFSLRNAALMEMLLKDMGY